MDARQVAGHVLSRRPDVPASDVGDPHALRIRAILNGETMQSSTTSNLIFGIDEIISYASQTSTLEAGDLILTGTPAGVGVFRDPKRLLRSGDTITIEIDGIGSITNPVVAVIAAAPSPYRAAARVVPGRATLLVGPVARSACAPTADRGSRAALPADPGRPRYLTCDRRSARHDPRALHGLFAPPAGFLASYRDAQGDRASPFLTIGVFGVLRPCHRTHGSWCC